MTRILYIEDIADNAALVQRIMDAQGYRLDWADTAEAGLALAELETPDLVLLDLGLPDLDGQTLVGYLRRLPGMALVPILVVSAWPVETVRRMVDAYGCTDYIDKPIDVRQFISKVNQYLAVQ